MEPSQEPISKLVNKEGMAMLLIGVLLIAAIAAMSTLSSDNREKVINDFCKVECKNDVQRKYKFCC